MVAALTLASLFAVPALAQSTEGTQPAETTGTEADIAPTPDTERLVDPTDIELPPGYRVEPVATGP